MEASFVLNLDSDLDGILINTEPISTFSFRRTMTTVPLSVWICQATEALAESLYQPEFPLRLAQLWEPVLRDRERLGDALASKREAFQRVRAAVQQLIEVSEPGRSGEIAAQRTKCVAGLLVQCRRLSELTGERLASVGAVGASRKRAAATHASVLGTLESMRARFHASNEGAVMWTERISEVIDEEFERHHDLARLAFESVTTTPTRTSVSEAAVHAPEPTGHPQLDQLVALGLQVAELQSLRDMIAAFEGHSHAIGECACSERSGNNDFKAPICTANEDLTWANLE